MKSGFINKQSAGCFFCFDGLDNLSLNIHASDGGPCIFTKALEMPFAEAFTVQGLDNNLHMRLPTALEKPSAILIKDFDLGDSGEYLQCPVGWACLGQQYQLTEVAFLRLIQCAQNNIDAVAPAKPDFESAIYDVGVEQAPVNYGGWTDVTHVAFIENAEVDSTLAILDNGVEIGLALVDASDSWSLSQGSLLIDGERSLAVANESKPGNKSEPSEACVAIFDAVALEKPVVGCVTDDQDSIQSVERADDTQSTQRGIADAGDTIYILGNGKLAIGENGKRGFTPQEPIGERKL